MKLPLQTSRALARAAAIFRDVLLIAALFSLATVYAQAGEARPAATQVLGSGVGPE